MLRAILRDSPLMLSARAGSEPYLITTVFSAEKTVVIKYGSDPALADSIKGLSRRMARSIEALKFRTNADPIDDLAMLGTINEAVLYAPEKAQELTETFMKNYNNLPEILKKQPRISEEDIQWFLAHCGWK